MTVENKILEWREFTSQITEDFLYDYFDDNKPDYYWVGDEVGGILNYGDYFFNFSDILICYKLEITFEQLINWYDFCLSNQSVRISLAEIYFKPPKKEKRQKKNI